jgi:hypothetical protein
MATLRFWSQAQMMAKEYKARGGDYNTPKENQDESQKHLSKWGEEEWQTKEGSAHAKKDDGTRKRYLPKKAWEEMNEEEKEETEQEKQEGSKEGHQFVQNTARAKAARKNATEAEDGKYEKEKKKTEQEKVRSGRQTRSSTRMEQGKDETTGQPAKKDNKQKQPAKAHDGQKHDNKEEQPGHKRSRSKNDKDDEEQDSKKKQKDNSGNAKRKSDPKTDGTVGSKHDKAEAPAAQGSISRPPKKGQTAHWKAMPGWVEGKVVEVLKAGKNVEGKQVKATKDDPRIVLKSNSSGKICVHKPNNVYFD